MTVAPDHAQVIAPPPLIVVAALLAGVDLRFHWPMALWPWEHV